MTIAYRCTCGRAWPQIAKCPYPNCPHSGKSEADLPTALDGAFAQLRPVSDPAAALPPVGSYCEISGNGFDLADDDLTYTRVAVVGYTPDGLFGCFQKDGCWPTVERLTNFRFKNVEAKYRVEQSANGWGAGKGHFYAGKKSVVKAWIATSSPHVEASLHVLYETGDVDAPESIKDRNGDVVLRLCRRCGAGEIELEESCVDRLVAKLREKNDSILDAKISMSIADALMSDFINRAVAAESAVWRIAPGTRKPDPFEGPGETYRAAYEREKARADALAFRDNVVAALDARVDAVEASLKGRRLVSVEDLERLVAALDAIIEVSNILPRKFPNMEAARDLAARIKRLLP